MTTLLAHIIGVILVASVLAAGAAGILAPGDAGAQGQAAAQAAVRDGNDMYEAFRRGDLERFASYTYRGLLEALGGKDRMIGVLEQGRAEMTAQGYTFVAGRVGPPITMVPAGAELHALLPLTQTLTAPGGELEVRGHLLGISADAGKSWTFIDAERLTPDNVRQVVPSYNPALKLPGKATTRFTPKR